MTTYIVNGNSTSPSITLDGFTENIDEQFIIITNNKCPVPYLKTITELTNSHNQIHHHKIASSKKKWFMSYIKNIYRNYLAEETDKVVIMPSTTITGASVEAYVSEGKVSIVPNYKFYKSDSTTLSQDMNLSDMLINNTNTGGRIHILIDYENVNNSGLDGTEYLTKNDYVTLFYSHSSGTIQQGYFDGLINNSGSFNIVKLSQTRKNALDYYIAIRVGEIIKEYPNEKLLIVSKDKGYYAVLEYCESYSEISDKIKLAPSIGTGLVMLDGNTNRRKVIMNKRRTIQLETEYQIHQERVALYKRVASALLSTPYSEEAKKASHLIETKNTPKELYMSSLHEFGVRRGQEIYRLIKNI